MRPEACLAQASSRTNAENPKRGRGRKEPDMTAKTKKTTTKKNLTRAEGIAKMQDAKAAKAAALRAEIKADREAHKAEKAKAKKAAKSSDVTDISLAEMTGADLRKAGKPAKGKKAGKAAKATVSDGKLRKPRDGNKRAIVAELLQRKGGVTGRELLDATGWPTMSVPAMARMSNLKLTTEKKDGKTIYSAKPL